MNCKCGKACFVSTHIADDFIKRRAHEVTLRRYLCEDCGFYHVTKQPLQIRPIQLRHAKQFLKYLQ
jgi:hypothetical protein